MAAPGPSPQQTLRIGALDGLRAVAILLVMLWHFTPGRDSSHGLASIPMKVADIGWLGVDMFFVLSGFLITRILLRLRGQPHALREFFALRFLRILPAYYLALFIAFVILPLLGIATLAPSDQVWYWLYIGNFHTAFPANVGVAHFWSLAVEMQFYLVWPLAILRLPNRTLWQVGIVAAVMACIGRGACAYFQDDWRLWMFWTPFRIDGVILGSLCALAVGDNAHFVRSPRRLWVVIAPAMLAVGGVAWFGRGTLGWHETAGAWQTIFQDAFLPFVASIGFAAALLECLRGGWLARAMDARWLKPIATYSYGAYLYHYMYLPWAERNWGPDHLRQWIPGTDAPVYVYLIACTAAALALAACSYHLWEVRFLRLKGRWRVSPAQEVSRVLREAEPRRAG